MERADEFQETIQIGNIVVPAGHIELVKLAAGDKVKIKLKPYSTSTFETYLGVVIGIDAFEVGPTVTIGYVHMIGEKPHFNRVTVSAESIDIHVVKIGEFQAATEIVEMFEAINEKVDEAKFRIAKMEKDKRAIDTFFRKKNEPTGPIM